MIQKIQLLLCSEMFWVCLETSGNPDLLLEVLNILNTFGGAMDDWGQWRMVGFKYRAKLRANCVRLKKMRCQAGDSPSWTSKLSNNVRCRSEHVRVLERPSQSPDSNRLYESVAVLENCSSQLLSIPSDWTGAIFYPKKNGQKLTLVNV